MENEFNILIRRMEKNLEMRHTYLMFAFTTAIAAIAALFVVDFASISPWICIVPFAVIIPFQARISYSRLSHAKMEAYMLVCYPGKFSFSEKSLNELSGIIGKIIAIISNYELTLLSIVIDILFILVKKYVLSTECWLSVDTVTIGVATFIVFGLATYTFPYSKFMEKYKGIYKEKICVH